MSDDLIHRLRSSLEVMAASVAVPMDLWDRHSNAALEAADRIAALTAENERLRDALREALDSLEYVERTLPGASGFGVRQERIAKIRALIGEKPERNIA